MPVKIENGELSIADLIKGDYISQEVLRVITGHDPHENADVYRLELQAVLFERARAVRDPEVAGRTAQRIADF